MRWRWVRLIGIVWGLALVCSAFGTQPQRVYACSCGMPEAPQIELKRASAVFVGRVVEVRPPPQRPTMSTADPTFIVFEVSQAWKGVDQTPFVVSTASSGATCGYTFEQGREYVVYAAPFTITKQRLDASLCSRTAPLDQAQEDVDVLGPGTQPVAVAAPTPLPPETSAAPTPSSQSASWIWLGFGAGVFVFLGLIVVLTRLQR